MDNQVRLRLGFVSSSEREGYAPTLELDDSASGQRIATIELTGEQFAMLVAGRQLTVNAQHMPSVETYAQRIGKKMEIRNVPVEEWPDGWTARKPGTEWSTREPTTEMRIVGRGFLAEGWQEYSWSYHNYGWSLTLRRWVEAH